MVIKLERPNHMINKDNRSKAIRRAGDRKRQGRTVGDVLEGAVTKPQRQKSTNSKISVI